MIPGEPVIGLARRRLNYGGVIYDGGEIEYPFVLTDTVFLADWPWHGAEGWVEVGVKFRPDRVELRGLLRGLRPTSREPFADGAKP